MKKKPKLLLDKQLVFEIIQEAISSKKGEEPVLLDLTDIKTASFDYFVIASGNSFTQVDAIANEIIDQLQEHLNLKPYHTEGFKNSEWILLDYYSILVHIFLKEKREHYQLEALWADAKFTNLEDNGKQTTTK
jgi:ribosome-associated protein